MSIWTRTGAKCAGHTSSATSAATPKGSPSKRPSASKASNSPAACSKHGAPTSTNTTTATSSRSRSRRSRPNYGGCSKTPARRARRTRWHRRFANNLLKVWPALWTFVTVDRAASYYSFSRSVTGAGVFGRRAGRASGCRAGRARVDDRARGGHGLLPVGGRQHGEIPVRWTDLPVRVAVDSPVGSSLASPAALAAVCRAA